MNILIIGNGGREHALAWACAKDDAVSHVFVANGNAGTADESKVSNSNLNYNDHQAVIDFCQKNTIAFVIVGPEAPLVAGIVDALQTAGIAVWGPSRACARLEGSKAFAKQFMQTHAIPTADYESFDNKDQAAAYIKKHGTPIVIKADGLAAGKGVVVATSEQEALNALDDMLSGNKFGQAGYQVVIEQYLTGQEASFICMVDGDNILPLATSQDHKRIGENDTGANTGGMGAYSPAPIVTAEVHDKVMTRIIRPVVQAMKDNGTPYVGFLYAGLMIDDNGDPYVIEFNCRFGDPETQPVLMRLKSSLVALIQQGLKGNLPTNADWDNRPALGIVMASRGYPESSSSGDIITGLPQHTDSKALFDNNAPLNNDIPLDTDTPLNNNTLKVFHAGTKLDGDKVVTNGGRVLCVTVMADDLKQAQNTALKACQAINFSGSYYRRDIGWRAIAQDGSKFNNNTTN